MASYGACDISDFGDGLVTQDLRGGELGGGGVFVHDAILYLVEGEKVPVGVLFTLLNPSFGWFATRNLILFGSNSPRLAARGMKDSLL